MLLYIVCMIRNSQRDGCGLETNAFTSPTKWNPTFSSKTRNSLDFQGYPTFPQPGKSRNKWDFHVLVYPTYSCFQKAGLTRNKWDNGVSLYPSFSYFWYKREFSRLFRTFWCFWKQISIDEGKSRNKREKRSPTYSLKILLL